MAIDLNSVNLASIVGSNAGCFAYDEHLVGLSQEAAAPLLKQLNPDWKYVANPDKGNYLERTFAFENFTPDQREYMDRVNDIAEQLNHHPDVFYTNGVVKVTLMTHSRNNNPTVNDFVLAAYIDAVPYTPRKSADGSGGIGCLCEPADTPSPSE